MAMMKRVATGYPNGIISWEDEIYSMLYNGYIYELEFMPDGVNKLWKNMEFARFCRESGKDRDAQTIYASILEEAVRGNAIISGCEDVAECAYQELASVSSFTEDDYAFESSSGILVLYRTLFEKSTEK